MAKDYGASISIKPLQLDRSDVERVHASGASGIAPVDAQVISPENRDVLLVVHVHDDKTQQIAVRLEPKALVEILGGVAEPDWMLGLSVRAFDFVAAKRAFRYQRIPGTPA